MIHCDTESYENWFDKWSFVFTLSAVYVVHSKSNDTVILQQMHNIWIQIF